MYEVANKLESKSTDSNSSSDDQFLTSKRYNPPKIEIVKEQNRKKESSKLVPLSPYFNPGKSPKTGVPVMKPKDNKIKRKYVSVKTEAHSTDTALNISAISATQPGYVSLNNNIVWVV